jgi:short subunit dehydrogenase-like uncharacterized protein
MRVAVVFDTPYSGWDYTDHERQMLPKPAAGEANESEVRTRRLPSRLHSFPLIVRPLKADASAGQHEPFISYGHHMANSAANAGTEYMDFTQGIVDAVVSLYERT